MADLDDKCIAWCKTSWLHPTVIIRVNGRILTKLTFSFAGFQHHHQSKWSVWCFSSGATKNNDWSLAIGKKLHLSFFGHGRTIFQVSLDVIFGFSANFRLEKWSSGNFCRNSAQPLSLIYISMVRLCVMSGSNTGLEAHIQK